MAKYLEDKHQSYDSLFSVESIDIKKDEERSEELFLDLGFSGAILLAITALIVYGIFCIIRHEWREHKSLKEFYTRNKAVIDELYNKLRRENFFGQYYDMCSKIEDILRKRNMYQMSEEDFPSIKYEHVFYNKLFSNLKYWIFQAYRNHNGEYGKGSALFSHLYDERLLLKPKDISEDMFAVETRYEYDENGFRNKYRAYVMKTGYMQKLATGMFQDINKLYGEEYKYFRVINVQLENEDVTEFRSLQEAKEELMITGVFVFGFNMTEIYNEIGDKLI